MGSTLAVVRVDDIAKLVGGLFVLVTAMLVLLRFSSLERISRSPRLAFSVGIRLTYVYGVGVFVLYWLLGLSANVVLIVAGVFFVLGLLASFEFENGLGFAVVGADLLGLALGLLVMVPVWMVKQFVLGFPDRDKIVLPAYSKINRIAKRPSPVRAIDELSHEPLTVVATLRPMGKVVWRDGHFDAISINGQYVEVGTKVRAQELRDQMFVVVPIVDESAATKVETDKESLSSEPSEGE